ncbi:Flp pilus assembly protein CpaB [Roseiconus lacunae]|uniref:Flp pilus assembly protein CpaB n=1 Tax=Roseiconus lacunae TaxID=2605694 RepID=UPI0011F2CF6F|nr:Flp pilus assembly protein CpaB [Roseiconus lacunae]
MQLPSNGPSNINSGTLLIGMFAVTVGLAGTYVLRVALRQEPPPVVAEQPEPEPEPPKRITVPLASRDIPVGTELTLDDVALYRLTQTEIETLIGKQAFMTNPKQIIGKVLQSSMQRNDAFNTKNLLPAGKFPGVSKRLKPGLRAVTIQMSSENALLGFATPGQHVDVLFHYGQMNGHDNSQGTAYPGFYPAHHVFNSPGLRDYHGNRIGNGSGGDLSAFQNATSTLIQDAEILAIGMSSTPTDLASPLPREESVRVTLAVAPKQAEMIRVAKGHGELSLTLRGPEDNQFVSLVDPVTLDHIMDFDTTVHEMEIYRGTALSKVHFGTNQSIREQVFTNHAGGEDPETDSQVDQSPPSVPAGWPVMVPIQSPMLGYFASPSATTGATPNATSDAAPENDR